MPASPRRPSGHRRLRNLMTAAASCAVLAPCGAAAPALEYPVSAPSVYEDIDPGTELARPRVRIGLTHERSGVAVSASGGFRILDAATGKPVWRDPFRGRVVVVPVGGAPGEERYVYSVQVAAFTDRDPAEALADELRSRFGEETTVHHDPDRALYRVRVGRRDSRAALGPLVGKLRRAGHDEVWISEEPAERREGVTLRLVDEAWFDFPTGAERLVIVPVGNARLRVEDRSYRGLLEARVDAFGGVRLINELPLEEYLRGVVPEELGPAVWPELEALKAQAVAARTYTLGNLGQFSSEGFDLCDTPRCQVYGGADSEHPVTDRAIAETAGVVLVHARRPIRALYTSTCGGHTEDGAEVFENETAPYLKGVPCVAGREVLEGSSRRIEGRATRAPGAAEAGSPSALDVGRLVVRGVVPSRALDGAWRADPVKPAEVAAWLPALARALGKDPAGGRIRNARTLGEIALALVDTVELGPRVQGRFASPDPEYALRAPDRDRIPAADRPRWAWLVGAGIVVPFEDGSLRPNHRPSRGLVLGMLGRTLELHGEGEPELVSFRTLRGDTLVGVSRSKTRTYRLGREPLLFVRDGGGERQVPALDLLPGDRLRLHRGADGRAGLIVAEERKGPTDDRFSVRYRWEKAYGRGELDEVVNARIPAGEVRNLEVTRRGRSGRATELLVRGSRGDFTVRGFRIRSVLGVDETLFTMDIQRDRAGNLKRVTFTGRGWGHGVGLCQVGAYGMALRGIDYRAILHHYYSDVTLVTAY